MEKTEDSTPNLEKGTDNIGISRLGDKGGVNDNEGHGQAV